MLLAGVSFFEGSVVRCLVLAGAGALLVRWSIFSGLEVRLNFVYCLRDSGVDILFFY